MLLREVLSDTHQPSFVEAADQQEHCSFKRDSWQRSWANFNIKWRYKMEQISPDFHHISSLQPENARSTPAQTNVFRLFQFITVESFIRLMR
jgi:hypothetical protein